MRQPGLVLALAALAVLPALSGCASPAPLRDFAPIASPDWRPGYAFQYANEQSSSSHVAVTRNGVPQSNGHDAATHAPVPGLSLEVLSTHVPDGDRPMYLVAAQVGTTVEALTADSRLAGRHPVGVRPSDLQVVDAMVHYAQACADICTTRASSLRYDAVSSYPWLEFPLVRGAKWSGPMPGLSPAGSVVGTMEVHSTVAGLDRVTTPLGEVDAVRVNHHIEAPQLAANLALLRDEGVARGYSAVDVSATLSFDRTIWFGPASHAVVRDESHMAFAERVAWTNHGDRYETAIDIASDSRQSLVAFTLGEVADLDLADALDALSPGSSKNAAPLAPVSTALRLTADHADANAAASQPITFRPIIPAGRGPGQDLSVFVVGAHGIVALQDDGSGAFRFVPPEMGLYTAVAQQSRDGAVVQRSSMQIPVRYDGQATIACPLADPGFNGCSTAVVPVRPGIRRLTIDATRSGAALPATLRLTAADGTTTSADFTGSHARIELDAFSPQGAAGPDWMLEYVPVVVAGETVDLHLRLDPEQPSPTTDGADVGVAALACTACEPW
ncbi:MAG: hypothetical protein V4510_12640 [bacterium]